MQDRHGHRISYLRVSVTDRCNERCTYCMPGELHEWLPREGILSYEETLRLIRIAADLGVSKVRITGGEPLTRRGILDFVREVPRIPGIADVGLSTNGTLLANEVEPDITIAAVLRDCGVRSVNISLDTLDPEGYAQITGRDFHEAALAGIEAARRAGFAQIKLNAVLMRGRNEDELVPLIEFAAERKLILRFIELMPVSTTEVLSDDNFMSIGEAKRLVESHYGGLIPEPEFRTNGPATYYQVPGRSQRIGFIGAMTNLHFCENCNKLRLTCDGKLRPCLGSSLEFDILKPMRAGATDAELREFFFDVVDRKPLQHDFRENYPAGAQDDCDRRVNETSFAPRRGWPRQNGGRLCQTAEPAHRYRLGKDPAGSEHARPDRKEREPQKATFLRSHESPEFKPPSKRRRSFRFATLCRSARSRSTSPLRNKEWKSSARREPWLRPV